MTTLTQQETDWLNCYHAWSAYMFEQAAEIGWNKDRAFNANDTYLIHASAYDQTYGERFVEDHEKAARLFAKRRAAA